jgi:hypothetical protein
MPSKKRAKDKRHTSFQDTFDEKHFTETFNRKAALFLQKQDDHFFAKDGDSDHNASKGDEAASIFERASEQDFCRSLLEKSRNGNTYTVTYEKAFKDLAQDQRWFGQGNSMQSCRSKLRATLCRDIYKDLDIENCGPTILMQLCQKHEIDCPLLSNYVQDREDLLSDFELLDRGQAKKLMIRVINGGSIPEDEEAKVKGVLWLPKFIKELAKIRRKLANEKEYIETEKRYPANTNNRDSKVVSAVLLSHENKALEQYYQFFKTKGIIENGECVLIFDGLMVRDTKRNCENLTKNFLFEASAHVQKQTGLLLTIRIKEFEEGYVLPADYESVQEDFFVIESGDDQKAAEILRKAAGARLVKCGNRFFYNHEKCLYREGEKEAKDGIMCLAKEVSIVADIGFGRTAPYSKDTSRMNKATQQVLSDQSIRDSRFVKDMWDSNRGYLNYTNGVYSFKEGRLLTFKEAKDRGICFTIDTGRAYTADVAKKDRDDLMSRIIDAMLPDAEQQKMILSCFARAMAGSIEDKRWIVAMGQRNCSKGIFCKLLMYAFGDFVQSTNAENLLVKDGSSQDAAKAQSWMQDLELKRIVFTSEMKSGKQKMDGDIIKKISSGGDMIEVRQNFTNENRIQVQATLVVFLNDTREATPADAYQTMIGIKFPNEYRDKFEFEELRDKGVEPPSHWRLKDPSIDEFIRKPGVIDAFTALIFEAFTPEKMAPPQRVKDDTNSIKGEASLSVEERFAEIIVKGQNTDVLFTKEIKRTLEECGVGTYSSAKIETWVKQVYDIDPSKPSRKDENGKSVQDRGFKGLRINDQHYNDREQHLKRTEHVRQSARLDFTNWNTSDPPGFSQAKQDNTDRLDQTRLNTERLDQTRLNTERLDQTRLNTERLDQTRLNTETLEQTRLNT